MIYMKKVRTRSAECNHRLRPSTPKPCCVKVKLFIAALTATLSVCAVTSNAVTDTAAEANTEETNVLVIIQTETVTEVNTEDTDPPMTGETKIVYEPNQGLLRRVNLSDVSVPKGNPSVNTEADITNDEPVTDPETEASAGEITEALPDNAGEQISDTAEKAEDKEQEKNPINTPAIAALGAVALTAAVISVGAAVFHSAKKKRDAAPDSQNNSESSGSDD